jgi:hypothetical protein
MPRINPTVTNKAAQIYNDMPHHDRGKFVSEAIEEKNAKEQGNIFTPEQIEYLNKHYIRKDDI